MWSNDTIDQSTGRRIPGQKSIVQMYRRAAAIPDQMYRDILWHACGVRTSTDPGLTQRDFDVVMAQLEARLWNAVDEGIVPVPAARRISQRQYWRNRLSRQESGGMNSRHAHRIQELWETLTPHLPGSERTDAYLCGIASRACGLRIEDRWTLKAWQAGLLIDALRDRLHYALRRGDIAVAQEVTQ